MHARGGHGAEGLTLCNTADCARSGCTATARHAEDAVLLAHRVVISHWVPQHSSPERPVLRAALGVARILTHMEFVATEAERFCRRAAFHLRCRHGEAGRAEGGGQLVRLGRRRRRRRRWRQQRWGRAAAYRSPLLAACCAIHRRITAVQPVERILARVLCAFVHARGGHGAEGLTLCNTADCARSGCTATARHAEDAVLLAHRVVISRWVPQHISPGRPVLRAALGVSARVLPHYEFFATEEAERFCRRVAFRLRCRHGEAG